MGLAQKGMAYIEPIEYLALEAVATDKHEYMDGVILAWQGDTVRGMAGASANHNRVAMNIAMQLRAAVAGTQCEVFAGDMKVAPLGDSAYYYPDVMVRCGEPLAGDALITHDACLVIEILSPTTEGFDRNDRFARYRESTSLESYVLVDLVQRRIEVHLRRDGWAPALSAGAGNVSLGVQGLQLSPTDTFAGMT